MAKPKRSYRSKSRQLREFSEYAEKLTSKTGVLFGIVRFVGFTDTRGELHPSGWNVHIDGLSFYAPSVDAGIGVLKGFEFGLDFELVKTAGRGYVSRVDCLEMVRNEVRRFLGETLTNGKGGPQALPSL